MHCGIVSASDDSREHAWRTRRGFAPSTSVQLGRTAVEDLQLRLGFRLHPRARLGAEREARAVDVEGVRRALRLRGDLVSSVPATVKRTATVSGSIVSPPEGSGIAYAQSMTVASTMPFATSSKITSKAASVAARAGSAVAWRATGNAPVPPVLSVPLAPAPGRCRRSCDEKRRPPPKRSACCQSRAQAGRHTPLAGNLSPLPTRRCQATSFRRAPAIRSRATCAPARLAPPHVR